MGVQNHDQSDEYSGVEHIDFAVVNRGFSAVLRGREYFSELSDIISHLNKMMSQQVGKRQSDTLFFDEGFQSTQVGRIWRRIKALYENGYGDIGDTVLEEGYSPQDDADTLRAQLEALTPSASGLDPETSDFIELFARSQRENAREDFEVFLRFLEVRAVALANIANKEELSLKQTDPGKSQLLKEARVSSVRALFVRGGASFLSSASKEMKARLYDAKLAARIPFYAGDENTAVDQVLGGFHSSGLVVAMGGTSGFKTGFKASIVANHCLKALEKGEEPPYIIGFAAEDGIEAYTRGVVTNLLNRDTQIQINAKRQSLRDFLGLQKFTIGQMQALSVENSQFRAIVDSTIESMMRNCFWMKSPEKVEQKVNFTVINIISAFEAMIKKGSAGIPPGTLPKFIVLDYLNLLHLPREKKPGSRQEELSMIAHILDEWAQNMGITIITSVQGTASGVAAARNDMRFLNQEDIHECKSIQHHTRMMISLLPFTDYVEGTNEERRLLAVNFLKNRLGAKNVIFVSSLEEGHNITFADSKLYTEKEWLNFTNNIVQRRNAQAEGPVKGGSRLGNPPPRANGGGRTSTATGDLQAFLNEEKGSI